MKTIEEMQDAFSVALEFIEELLGNDADDSPTYLYLKAFDLESQN